MHHDLPALRAEMFSAATKPDTLAWLMISHAAVPQWTEERLEDQRAVASPSATTKGAIPATFAPSLSRAILVL
jgi:hypothetical protein